MADDTPIYSIRELAEAGGVTRRTVRYYVQRGLIPAPTGTGRGRHYTEEHLRALLEVRKRQESGESLESIQASRETAEAGVEAALAQVRPAAGATDPKLTPEGPAATSVWVRIAVDSDLEIHVRNPTALDGATAAKVAEAVRQVLCNTEKESSP